MHITFVPDLRKSWTIPQNAWNDVAFEDRTKHGGVRKPPSMVSGTVKEISMRNFEPLRIKLNNVVSTEISHEKSETDTGSRVISF